MSTLTCTLCDEPIEPHFSGLCDDCYWLETRLGRQYKGATDATDN
jgi:NMD protein affecting ribosome stability and mRNA decay